MKIYLGADHRGYELKEKIKGWLEKWEMEYEDLGNSQYDKGDDYPDFGARVAKAVAGGGRGILICGSGTGMDMVANKHRGVRSVLGYKPEQVRHGVEVEAANVLSLGVKYYTDEEAKKMVKVFLATKPKKAERHVRRRGKINIIEERKQLC